MNKLLVFSIFLLVLALAAFGFNQLYLSPVNNSEFVQTFIVPENTENFNLISALKEQNLIKNEKAFGFIFSNLSGVGSVSSGGYKLSQNMNAWEVMRRISGKPDMIWFTTSFCFRKEQIGEKLQSALNWNAQELSDWNGAYGTDSQYFEGVYYPDTYLIPVTETPAQVAKRFINNFNSKVSPLFTEMTAKNIKWTTALKIASLIARESGGPDDAKLISGIIWNRLDKNMPLQIDATLAYTLGKNINGSWWGTIDIAQKQSNSPYNSYKYKGLPPTPICSPDESEIEAAINPETTDCLFYLHDPNKQIHCAATYKEHLANIKKYLD